LEILVILSPSPGIVLLPDIVTDAGVVIVVVVGLSRGRSGADDDGVEGEVAGGEALGVY
jgi:hypothetical protein